MDFDDDDYALSDGDDYDDSDKITDDDDNSFQNESWANDPFPILPNSLFVNQSDQQMDESVEEDETNNVFDNAPVAERSSKQMEITFANLQNLRREDTCDLTIVCKERKFPVHRLVLRAGSSYFETMFTCGLQEKTASVINLPAIDSDSMALILDFLYLQKVNVNCLDLNGLLDLISSSHSIEVLPLFEICCDVLARKININNWEVILKVGTKYDNKALVADVVQYLVVSFDWNTANESFWNLDMDCFKKLISSPITARYHSADSILKIIMQWLAVNTGDREKYLNDLIFHVDFGSISREALDNLLSNDALIRNSFPICRMLLEKVSAVFNNPLEYKSVLISPKILLLRGDMIESFDIKTRVWSSKTIPTVISQKCCAVTESTVYFLGGASDRRSYQSDEAMSIIAYYPHTNCVNSISTSHPFRTQMGAAAKGKFLYIVGGCDRYEKPVDAMEQFNVETSRWTILPSPIIHRYSPHVLAFEEFILLIGGYQAKLGNNYQDSDSVKQNVVRIVEKYCIQTKQWSVISTIPGKNIRSLSVVPFCMKLFIRTPTMFCEYDVKNDKWEAVMPDWKPGNGNTAGTKWDLCSSTKPLPFLIVEEMCSTNNFYKLDPHSKQCVYLTEKPTNNSRYDTCIRLRNEVGPIVFA